MSKSEPKLTLTDVLIAAIKESGLSAYRISKDTGVVVSSIIRFVDGETSLRLDKADAMAEYLGLRLVPDPDATPPEPTPENLARPMLTKLKAESTRKTGTRKEKAKRPARSRRK